MILFIKHYFNFMMIIIITITITATITVAIIKIERQTQGFNSLTSVAFVKTFIAFVKTPIVVIIRYFNSSIQKNLEIAFMGIKMIKTQIIVVSGYRITIK